MSKVLIINSPLFADKRSEHDEDYLPPIGLGYIATNLHKAGHEVRLIDAVADNLIVEDLLGMVNDFNPDVVALNIFTTNYILVRKIVESIDNKTIRILIGGLSTRSLYKEIFTWHSKNKIDVVCGDGELITGALVSESENENPLEEQPLRRFFLVNKHSQYFVQDISQVPLSRDFFEKEPTAHPMGFKEVSIITSRGCIFNCTFCSAARSLNIDMQIREMTEKAVIRDLSYILSKYREATHIRVLDDLFLKNSKSIERAIRIFKQFPFKWRAMAHVQTFQKVEVETLKQLHKNRCVELFIGVESGSPKILNRVHKTSDILTIKINLQKVMLAGIGIKAYFLYGFPAETKEDFEQTYSLAVSLKKMAADIGVSFRTSVFQFRPYHGTEIYQKLQANHVTQNLLDNVTENRDLSNHIGRSQFNFESGNYSQEKTELVNEFIKKTMDVRNLDF